MTPISFQDLRTLLVNTIQPYEQDLTSGAGVEEVLRSPNVANIWRELIKIIGENCTKNPPFNLIYCLLAELKKRGIITEKEIEMMNHSMYITPLAEIHRDMIDGRGLDGVWAMVGRRFAVPIAQKMRVKVQNW